MALALNDRSDLKTLRAEINSALDQIGKRHDLSLSIGNISYDLDGADATTRLTMLSAKGVQQNAPEALFKKHCRRFGLKPEMLGFEFRSPYGLERYRVCGIKPRARKNAVLVERIPDGRRVVCPPWVVLDSWNKAKEQKAA